MSPGTGRGCLGAPLTLHLVSADWLVPCRWARRQQERKRGAEAQTSACDNKAFPGCGPWMRLGSGHYAASFVCVCVLSLAPLLLGRVHPSYEKNGAQTRREVAYDTGQALPRASTQERTTCDARGTKLVTHETRSSRDPKTHAASLAHTEVTQGVIGLRADHHNL